MLRFLTAGESHGPALTAIIEGLPAGVPIDAAAINRDLQRRQQGHGRGRRMQIETDTVAILSGVRHGRTLGSPVTLRVENRDWANWSDVMAPEALTPADDEQRRRWESRRVTRPRPGHADLVGSLKYNFDDARNILERASARESTMRVAVGAVAKQFLAAFGIQCIGHVVAIGAVSADEATLRQLTPEQLSRQAEASPVRCADPAAAAQMVAAIDAAKADGDSLGGIIEVICTGLPPGLGSHVHWDRKLDGALAAALMSVQAMKGVEFGLGFAGARLPGSQAHDPIAWSPERGYYRTSNHAGGLEGSMTTGMPLWVRVAQKPIATLYKPLPSVDMHTHEPIAAGVERSDTCAVPAGAVICECVTAFTVADFFGQKFGGDSLDEVRRHYESYLAYLRGR